MSTRQISSLIVDQLDAMTTAQLASLTTGARWPH
jgi:hypothetical protein